MDAWEWISAMVLIALFVVLFVTSFGAHDPIDGLFDAIEKAADSGHNRPALNNESNDQDRKAYSGIAYPRFVQSGTVNPSS
jgi:hypothetical protein